MAMSNSLELFNSGRLLDAIQAAVAEVREDPADIDKRWTLATLVCFNGDYDRADKHLQAVLTTAPDLAGEVLLFRNLLRGEVTRRQCFEEGRLPTFPELPSDRIQQLLRALAMNVSGEPDAYVAAVQKVVLGLPTISGELNGEPFTGIRDWDDFLSGVIDVITVNGDYYWLGLEQVRQISFYPVEEMRDMIWRQADLTTSDGATVMAFLPVLYPGTADDADEAIRLGRAADWFEAPAGVLRGKGIRSWEIGEVTYPTSQIGELKFSNLTL